MRLCAPERQAPRGDRLPRASSSTGCPRCEHQGTRPKLPPGARSFAASEPGESEKHSAEEARAPRASSSRRLFGTHSGSFRRLRSGRSGSGSLLPRTNQSRSAALFPPSSEAARRLRERRGRFPKGHPHVASPAGIRNEGGPFLRVAASVCGGGGERPNSLLKGQFKTILPTLRIIFFCGGGVTPARKSKLRGSSKATRAQRPRFPKNLLAMEEAPVLLLSEGRLEMPRSGSTRCPSPRAAGRRLAAFRSRPLPLTASPATLEHPWSRGAPQPGEPPPRPAVPREPRRPKSPAGRDPRP